MIPYEELIKEFEKWMSEIKMGIGNKDGSKLCEGTRMVLAFALILHSDHPEKFAISVGKQIRDRFTNALNCVSGVLSEDEGQNGPDGCYDLYERNIRERLVKFDEWSKEWWGVGVTS
ncbi:MAG: hypothetical protein ACW98K_16360 [Candidatus Kariarchaeaceae archaeon]|jgi:hypothetical protein